MFTIFKKLFAKSEPKTVVKAAAPVRQEPSAPMPSVEVAHLSLTAIVSRLPDDLKALVQTPPDEAATVAFPIQTILKQLPGGSVRMSFASLHRQAHGVFGPLPAGDKRSVEVPLSEVFRHVRPHALKRREQRTSDLAGNGFNLFGNAANPYEISPSIPDESGPAAPQTLDLTSEMPRVLKMDDNLREHFGGGVKPRAAAAPPAPVPAPSLKLAHESEARGAVVPRAAFAPSAPAAAPDNAPPLVLPLADISSTWPEEFRAEAGALDPSTTVALPASAITAGLAKGRVSFTWGEIFARLDPQPSSPTALPETTALQLPLKIVAPAFLAASKAPKADRKSVSLDDSIPALFNDQRGPAPATDHPEPPPAKSAALPMPETAAATHEAPETVGQIFGEPTKTDWTPSEIVQHTVKLPGVAGAIVALQEGLQVATSLPEGVKSDVVAAFLPQIFARLNQYAGEMKMGEVDDLLFTTHGAHCQIYRLGFVYFAVLGKPGESLPWHELRLICEELARQTNK